MAYTCYDCSYTGKARTATGACPACGSMNIRRAGSESGDKQTTGSRRLTLALVLGLWVYLAGHILWKLQGP